ncbi:MAG TPA: hypothetical protein VN193_14630 [Candidatus Angelobacter sp.]|jgi:hypothetical protein|nr:hypothetical protein [Candidatus Angelobacter sp.]
MWRVRGVAAALAVLACCGALGACGSTQAGAASLAAGTYSGTLPSGTPVTLSVNTGAVQVDGRDTRLPDPTSTGEFVISSDGGRSYTDWQCVAAEAGRSLHCDIWKAPGGPTPTAIPCVSPGPSAPDWCGGDGHVTLDLLRTCSTAGCT